MLTSDHARARTQSQDPQTRPMRLGLVTVTALPLLAALLAACNPGAGPTGLVAGAQASNSPTVKPSAKPSPGGASSPATSVRPGASTSPGSQSLSSASPAASAGSGSGSDSGSTAGSSSSSPAASPSAGSEASSGPVPEATASADSDVYDTAIHLSEPVEARYVFKQRSDFSSLYPTVRYSSYPYYGGYNGGISIPGSSYYYPSIFGKIESNTTVKFRFEPKPSRTMLVDLWLENRNYGSINYNSPSPYATATPYPYYSATSYPYYDISTVDQTSFAVAQASGQPSSDPSAQPTAQPSASASPVYTEHYRVLVRLNGEIKEYIEPAYIAGTDYSAQIYQRQIASLLRPFFSSYSPELVHRGISWPARDNLFTEFDTLAGTSGQLRVTRSPSWSMESGGKTVELSYRSEVKVTSKDGETESVQSFKESAKASIDPATGLMLKMTSSLSVNDDDKTPYYLELERL